MDFIRSAVRAIEQRSGPVKRYLNRRIDLIGRLVSDLRVVPDKLPPWGATFIA